MTKKKIKSRSKENVWEKYKIFIIPSAIGGIIAWFFSASFELGVAVFIAVWIGNWIGMQMRSKNK
ncbi:MAG TPA: hypothetical protein PKA38_04450 [Candidatus Levybacteria bacterium]|nr:hypothetical protein [Candidatus Levybacteria bacterium]